MSLKCWKHFRELDDVFRSNIKIALTVDLDDHIGEQLAAIMVMHNGDVYSIGTNAHACLGVKGIDRSAVPVKVSALCQKGIQKLAGGYGHILALTKDGQLLAWGDNKFGQLGKLPTGPKGNEWYNFIDRKVSVPISVKGALEGKKVVDVACGFNHTLAVTSEGHVYGWGYNKHGRVGVGSGEYVIGTPTKVVFPDDDGTRIKAVSCGRHFSVALSDTGKIFVWGSNEYRQLGITEGSVSVSPKELKLHCVFTSIACGAWHTVALTDKNEVVRWGYDGNKIAPPEGVAKDLGPVLEVAATFHHPITVLRAKKGLYVHGQCLGQTTTSTLTNYQSIDEAFAYCASIPVMWRQMSFEKTGPTLADVWLAAFENQDDEDCDIEFHVDEKVIRAHKFFLKTRSEHFRRFLTGPWGESCNGVVQVDEFDYETFHAFIRYLYSDWVEPGTVTEMSELLKIADYYGEPDLHARCQKILKACTAVDNVCSIFSLSRQCNATELEEYALKFLQENYGKIMQIPNNGFEHVDNESRKLIINAVPT